ncbi:MAG: hypothetical protein AAB495_04155 [Patescibacteria group bacterium]
MTIVFAFISIFCLGGIAWSLDQLKVFPFRICAICVGTAGTWIVLLTLRAYGFAVDPIVIAALLGGSAVGIAYQGDKMLAQKKSSLLWKMLFIPTGFVAAYALVSELWLFGVLVIFILVTIAFVFLDFFSKKTALIDTPATNEEQRKKVEKMLDDCC